MSKEEIRKILYSVDRERYSHVFICLDTWDYDYFSEYIDRKDDIDDSIEIFWEEHEGGMFEIKEIYNLDLDIEMQLNERRAYHVEKAKRIESVGTRYQVENKDLLNKSLEFATEKHKGQMRKGKNPKEYITHPVNVANLIRKYINNSHNIDNLVAAAYLHDTIEDTDTTYYNLVEIFGYEVANLVYELTNDKDMKRKLGKAKYLSIKMKNMSDDALDIKLCDRLDNISGLADTDESFRIKYINETIYIIDYILKNRKLKKTHISIINDILSILKIIIPYQYSGDSKELIDVNTLIMKINENIKN